MTPDGPLPEETPVPLPAAVPYPPVVVAEPEYHWYHKVAAVLFITFCLDIGLFLLIFPWTDYWDNFTAFAHNWRAYFDTMYIRGAISGIGVVNLYLSLGEVFRLRRFSKH